MVRRKGLEYDGYLDPSRAAVIDDAHLARVNYEAFFFRSPEARARFLEDPIAYCGLVTDPVSKRRFHPKRGARRLERDGVLWLFESRWTYDSFRSNPTIHERPGWTM